jgi:hypothetical protein
METSRQEYPALLVSSDSLEVVATASRSSNQQATLDPNQAVTVLNNRVDVISKINNDIADWLLVREKSWQLQAQPSHHLPFRRNDGKWRKHMPKAFEGLPESRKEMGLHHWGITSVQSRFHIC